MIPWFFKQASKRILYPISEKTGQSEYVNNKLGYRNSIKRHLRSQTFENIDFRMEQSKDDKSITEWKKILDGN